MNRNLGFGITTLAAIVLVFAGAASADDLNPAPYRGDPLSIWIEWASDPGTAFPADYSAFRFVDDEDPDTYLNPTLGPYWEQPGPESYSFAIPNVIDELPLKLMRIQVTWSGTTQPPAISGVTGFEGGDPYFGYQQYASPVQPFTQPDGGYQYFDWEIVPNPDWEVFTLVLAPGAVLEQVVVDTISIPEPATLSILALGGLAILKRKR